MTSKPTVITYIFHWERFFYYDFHLCPGMNVSPQSKKQEQLWARQKWENYFPWIEIFYKSIIYFQKVKPNVHGASIKISVVGEQCLPSILKVLGLTQRCKNMQVLKAKINATHEQWTPNKCPHHFNLPHLSLSCLLLASILRNADWRAVVGKVIRWIQESQGTRSKSTALIQVVMEQW